MARTAGAQLSSPHWICCWLCCSPPIMLGQSCCCCLGWSQATFLPSQILPVGFVTCSGEPCRMLANVIVNRGSCEMKYLTHWHSVQQSRHGGQRSGLQHSIDLHWSDKKLHDKNAILSGLHFLFTVYRLDLDIYYQPSRATFLGTIFHHRRFSFEYLL